MILKGIDIKPMNTKSKRGFRFDPFYHTKEWREFRRIYLIENPLCKFCDEKGLLTTATVLDHIQPRSQGGSDYATWNLQGLCKSCHGKKSNLDKEG